MITITNGVTTITPELRVGFESSNESNTIVHRLVGGGIAITLAPDTPRSGSLSLLFSTSTAAETARDALAQPSVWSVTDDLAAVSFSFVRSGRLGAVQQEDRTHWILELGYQEVPA